MITQHNMLFRKDRFDFSSNQNYTAKIYVKLQISKEKFIQEAKN
jgi:hypothetical protein